MWEGSLCQKCFPIQRVIELNHKKKQLNTCYTPNPAKARGDSSVTWVTLPPTQTGYFNYHL